VGLEPTTFSLATRCSTTELQPRIASEFLAYCVPTFRWSRGLYFPIPPWRKRRGDGRERDRTADPLDAIEVLSQLSYAPEHSIVLRTPVCTLPNATDEAAGVYLSVMLVNREHMIRSVRCSGAVIATETLPSGAAFRTSTDALPLLPGASNVRRVTARTWVSIFPGGSGLRPLLLTPTVIVVVAQENLQGLECQTGIEPVE
jgi:hypothetical protein